VLQAANLSDWRIESNRKNRFDSENRIESNRNFFLPELECSTAGSRPTACSRCLRRCGHYCRVNNPSLLITMRCIDHLASSWRHTTCCNFPIQPSWNCSLLATAHPFVLLALKSFTPIIFSMSAKHEWRRSSCVNKKDDCRCGVWNDKSLQCIGTVQSHENDSTYK